MIPSNAKSEYLSKDILEDVFVHSFKWVCQVQMVMGSCRVHLKDRFVTSPSRWQKIYTLCVISVCIVLDFVVVTTYFKGLERNAILYSLITASLSVNMTVSSLSTVHVRFFNSSDNADFYIGLQKIDRLMAIDRNVYINGIPRRINITTVTVIITCIGLIFLVSCSDFRLATLGFIGTAFAQSTFILELAYCANIVIFYFLRISFVNSIINNHLKNYKCHVKQTIDLKFPTKKVLGNLAAQTHEFTTSNTVIFLKEILESFQKFQNIYRFQVLLFFSRMVLFSIFSFEVILIGMQSGNLNRLDTVIICFFILLDILIIILLCLRVQLFFGQVKETKRLCISVMSEYQEGELREKAKRMYKMADDTPPHFSVYDMWQVDSRVLLQLFMLITTIIVTLIQFALL